VCKASFLSSGECQNPPTNGMDERRDAISIIINCYINAESVRIICGFPLHQCFNIEDIRRRLI
jgi:hypothetical protein